MVFPPVCVKVEFAPESEIPEDNPNPPVAVISPALCTKEAMGLVKAIPCEARPFPPLAKRFPAVYDCTIYD